MDSCFPANQVSSGSLLYHMLISLCEMYFSLFYLYGGDTQHNRSLVIQSRFSETPWETDSWNISIHFTWYLPFNYLINPNQVRGGGWHTQKVSLKLHLTCDRTSTWKSNKIFPSCWILILIQWGEISTQFSKAAGEYAKRNLGSNGPKSISECLIWCFVLCRYICWSWCKRWSSIIYYWSF